jgi:hypothetical protein
MPELKVYNKGYTVYQVKSGRFKGVIYYKTKRYCVPTFNTREEVINEAIKMKNKLIEEDKKEHISKEISRNKDGVAKIDINRNNKIYECLIDDDLWHELAQFNYNISIRKQKNSDKFYVMRSKDNKNIHHIVMNVPKCTMIDHINGNPLDNRKGNLRITNPSLNAHNIVNSKHEYVGVYQRGTYVNGDLKYEAQIKMNKKRYSAKFRDKKEAVEWRNQKAIELYGEFASLQVWVPENSV